jgi:hypothetical protein
MWALSGTTQVFTISWTVNTIYFYRRLEVEKLRMIVRHIIQFVTIRQFPPADKSLPPLSKSRWWIPTGTKTLALISGCCCYHVLVTVCGKAVLTLCCILSTVWGMLNIHNVLGVESTSVITRLFVIILTDYILSFILTLVAEFGIERKTFGIQMLPHCLDVMEDNSKMLNK